ncbi:MAG TPA: D-glycerate dehydrogenase [Thermoanaerobaculia bacterium]|nr:D-glycerate dehydrogenase [Thermoanaerobaculia bacterium]
MRYTVVLTADFPSIATDLLAPHVDVIAHPTEHGRTEDDLITLLAEADAAIVLLQDPITRRVLEANPNLRCISNFAVGYNNIDIDAAREFGVTVTNTPGMLTEATADLTMALILAVTRRIVEGDLEMRATGRCEWEPLKLLGASLQGKRLGIVGMGRIGSAVATRARAFGLDVVGIRRGDSLDELLATSDIVSLHAPLSRETRHMIDASALARMKPGSYLVNTSRGALVDEEALCDALESGHLRGAALDVYEYEPEVNPRLLALPNVVIVPHIGSATEEARNAMARIAAMNVLLFLQGGEPLHRVV